MAQTRAASPVLLMWMVSAWSGAAQASMLYSVVDLGDLAGAPDYSEAFGINNNSQVTGFGMNFSVRGFLWEAGVMTDIGSERRPQRINDQGHVVGFIPWSITRREAFFWNGSKTTILSLPSIYAEASDVNNSGHVVGSYGQSSHAGYLWENGAVLTLQKLPGDDHAYAQAINDNDQIVGRSGSRAVLWQNGAVSDLGQLPDGPAPGLYSYWAQDINDNAQVVGFCVRGSLVGTGFLWEQGQMREILVGDGITRIRPNAINNAGQAVGLGTTSAGNHAFLWEDDVMYDLNHLLDATGQGWILTEARDVNELGEIVGYGTDPSGATHGFLLRPIPEPATLSLLALAFLSVILRRTR